MPPRERSRSGPGGTASYLVIPQNYNTGWVATLDGRTLDAVRIDGWQQAYVVPAGQAGTVHLTMASDDLFRLGLVLGALLLAVLLLLALLPSSRPALEPSGPRRPPSFWVLSIGTVLVLFLVAGPVAVVALPLLAAARRWGGGLMAPVAFIAFVAAGVAVAWNPGAVPSTHLGAFGHPAQIASVVALGAVLSAAAADRISPKTGAARAHEGPDSTAASLEPAPTAARPEGFEPSHTL